MNALLCVAFLKQSLGPALKQIATRRPKELLQHSGIAVNLVTNLMDVLVTALGGYIEPSGKTRGGIEIKTELRAMCHLLGPRQPKESSGVKHLCRVAEFCRVDFRAHSEEQSVAALLASDPERVLVRALKGTKFSHGPSTAKYAKEREWRAVYIFAVPIIMTDGSGPMGSSAGVITLDVCCHQKRWRNDDQKAASALVDGMMIRLDEQTKRIETVLNHAAKLSRELLMDSTTQERIIKFTAEAD